jgi:hypothetical protein
LRQFFGVSLERRLVVYLSNVFVQTGHGPESGVEYSGTAIPLREAEAFADYQRAFTFRIPGAEIVGVLTSAFADVTVEARTKGPVVTSTAASAVIAPRRMPSAPAYTRHDLGIVKIFQAVADGDQVEPNSSLVILGSPAFNGAAAWLQETHELHASFNANSSGIVAGGSTWSDGDHALIARVIAPDERRTILYVAGMSEPGTLAASRYLLAQWEVLYSYYGVHNPFAVVLATSSGEPSASRILWRSH